MWAKYWLILALPSQKAYVQITQLVMPYHIFTGKDLKSFKTGLLFMYIYYNKNILHRKEIKAKTQKEQEKI